MSFSDELIQFGRPILKIILEHPIIVSLAGISDQRTKTREQLILARNNFYLQDYFFLVYAYKVPQLFIIDSSNNFSFNLTLLGKNIKESQIKFVFELLTRYFFVAFLHLSEILREKNSILLDKNPFKSKTITKIRSIINNIDDIQIEGSRPNFVTQNYIAFKHRSAFQGDIEAIVSSLPCVYIYAFLTKILENSPLRTDEDFKGWIEFLTNPTNIYYYQQTQKVCERLASYEEIYSHSKKRKRIELINIFMTACRLELDFMNTLLSE